MVEYSNEQKLVNIIFATAISAKTHAEWYEKKTVPEIVQHIRQELHSVGFHTNPIGSMWGKLTTEKDYDPTIIP